MGKMSFLLLDTWEHILSSNSLFVQMCMIMKENTDVDVAAATIHLIGEQSIVYEFFFCLRFFPAFLVWTDELLWTG